MQTIELYVLRHGIAEDENPAHPGDDHARRLTPAGIEKTRLAAWGMRALGVAPDRILASPHIRAAQTAEIAAEILAPPEGLHTEVALRLGGPIGAIVERAFAAEVPRVMIVGHNPTLSELVAELTASGRLRASMKKAGLAHLRLHRTFRGPIGELVAFLPPRVLRAVGRPTLPSS